MFNVKKQADHLQDEIIFNIDDFIDNIQPLVDLVKEREIVLVFGNKGSGKSTLINYLQGNSLAYSTAAQDKLHVTHSVNVPSPNIGDTDMAEEHVTRAYPSKSHQYYFLELNLGGNSESNIKHHILISELLKNVSSVKAMIVLFDINDFAIKRAESTKKTVSHLANLIKPDAFNSCFFIFNDRKKINDIHSVIQESQLNYDLNKIYQAMQDLSGKRCLRHLLENPEDRCIGNFVDNGALSRKYDQFLGRSSSITINLIINRLDRYLMSAIREAIKDRAAYFIRDYYQIRHQSNILKQLSEEIAAARNRIGELESTLSNLQKNNTLFSKVKDSKTQLVDDIQSKVSILTTLITQKSSQIHQLEINIKKLNKKLQAIKPTEAIQHSASQDLNFFKPAVNGILPSAAPFLNFVDLTIETVTTINSYPKEYQQTIFERANLVIEYESLKFDQQREHLNLKFLTDLLVLQQESLSQYHSDSNLTQSLKQKLMTRIQQDMIHDSKLLSEKINKYQEIDSMKLNLMKQCQNHGYLFKFAKYVCEVFFINDQIIDDFIDGYQKLEDSQDDNQTTFSI